MTTPETVPLAVPDLAVAAQILGQPLDMVKDAAQGIRPYPHQDARPFWSLHLLAVALGVVEPREVQKRRHRGLAREPERSAS